MKKNINHIQLDKRIELEHLSDIVAKEFMRRDVLTVVDGVTIGEVISIMKDNKVSGLPVVDNKQSLIGIITEYDLLIQAGSRPLEDKIEYSSNIVTISPDTLLKDILILFFKHRVRRLPVVTPSLKVIGIISRVDLLDRIFRACT